MDAPPAQPPPPSIDDYGAIGDCRSVGLVSRDGALDWLCWPRFDSPAVFAALLDPQRGGTWWITPRNVRQRARRYVGRTNVLETTFVTDAGAVVTLTDFMPVAGPDCERTKLLPDSAVLRIVRCTHGQATVDVRYAPRPGFARRVPRLIDRGKLGIRLTTRGRLLTLMHDVAFDVTGGDAAAVFTLNAGEEKAFMLTFAAEAPAVLPPCSEARPALDRTLGWWEQWADQCAYAGPYADAVLRSVLTLKLLSYPLSGAIVAAATTSLPERLGGRLNWDYRFCWLRDATLIVECLVGTGFYDEAAAFCEWLLHATRRTQPRLRVAYDVYGNDVPRERSLSHLAGYRDSTPVQVGNGARGQIQLDVQGEVIAAVATLLEHQGKADRETARVLVRLGEYVCDHWRDPDAGLWEERGPSKVHTHSRVLAWTALDALLRLHAKGLVDGVPAARFELARADIRQAIETESWLGDEQTYTNEPGTLKLDASLLMMALVGFAEPGGERMRQTRARLRAQLGAGDALLRRNAKPAGESEGAFGICGFWDAEFLARGGGTLDEATTLFEKLVAYGNDLGLHAEEVDPDTGDALGNFPQAFTHVGLIKAALAIKRRTRSSAAVAEGAA